MSVFVVLFLLYIVRTLLAVLVGSFSRMSSIYGSNPFKTRSCKQVDPMYYCLDQYIAQGNLGGKGVFFVLPKSINRL